MSELAPHGPRTWAGLSPDGRITGAVRVPGSKSLAQRALVMAALAQGTTRVTNLSGGDDVESARRLIEAAGASVQELAPAALAISGRPPGPHRGWNPEQALQAGESGTLARLATAALAWCANAGRVHQLDVSGSLRARSSRALFEALRTSGVELEFLARADAWPVRVRPLGPPNEVELRDARSSQEVSALLIAAAAYPGELRLHVAGAIPSRPYLELTIAALASFGARVESHVHGTGETFTVRGPLRAPSAPIAIEADASAAAVALAAGCLSGGAVRVEGLPLDTRQGDARIVAHLSAFGCVARHTERGLEAHGLPTRGAELDLDGEPDLAPVLAAVAARAALALGVRSSLSGLGTLPGKESSRIEVLARGLQAVGLDARASAERLEIHASVRPAPARVELDPHGDHRMAFAFALLGLSLEGVRVRDPACVSKSWPQFWTSLERAGASVHWE
jgi:3-phosphoshikimate 1-carboxyvinyltransferase